jgi:SAM-dependent methyltransferase
MFGWKDLSQYDFRVVTLFEPIQLQWMYEWKDQRSIGLLMNHYPTVSWYLKHVDNDLGTKFRYLEQKYNEIIDKSSLHSLERALIDSMEDWIIYVTDPDVYDQLSFNRWDDQELLSLADFKAKTVVDIGSGTGSQLFRLAPIVKTIYGVEPIQHLRHYLKTKATSLGLNNVFIQEGRMTDIPFPNDFCDMIVSGHVFGDEPKAELAEMMRVVKSNGMIILMPGNNDTDNTRHQFLVENVFHWERYVEPGPDAGFGWKRKYWMIKKEK